MATVSQIRQAVGSLQSRTRRQSAVTRWLPRRNCRGARCRRTALMSAFIGKLPDARGLCPAVLVVAPVSSSGSSPRGWVVEVEPAGGVEGVLAGADGQAGGEDRFVVVVVAGPVDRRLPLVGGAHRTEPA